METETVMEMEKWGLKGKILEELDDQEHGKVIPFLTEKGWCYFKPKEKIKKFWFEKTDDENIYIPYQEYEIVKNRDAYRGELPFNYIVRVLDSSVSPDDVIGAINDRNGGVENIVLDYIKIGNFYFLQTEIKKHKC